MFSSEICSVGRFCEWVCWWLCMWQWGEKYLWRDRGSIEWPSSLVKTSVYFSLNWCSKVFRHLWQVFAEKKSLVFLRSFSKLIEKVDVGEHNWSRSIYLYKSSWATFTFLVFAEKKSLVFLRSFSKLIEKVDVGEHNWSRSIYLYKSSWATFTFLVFACLTNTWRSHRWCNGGFSLSMILTRLTLEKERRLAQMSFVVPPCWKQRELD